MAKRNKKSKKLDSRLQSLIKSPTTETRSGIVVPQGVLEDMYKDVISKADEYAESRYEQIAKAAVFGGATRRNQKGYKDLEIKSYLLQSLSYPTRGYQAWLNKPFGRRYEDLRILHDMVPLITLLVNLRQNHLMELANQTDSEKSLGWNVEPVGADDPEKDTGERNEFKERVRQSIISVLKKPHELYCDSFSNFLIQQSTNYYCYDRMAAECLYNSSGILHSYVTVDGSTIMPLFYYLTKYFKAMQDTKREEDNVEILRRKFLEQNAHLNPPEDAAYVQIMPSEPNRPVAIYSPDEMIIHVSRQTSFLDMHGFGQSLIEKCLVLMDAWAHSYAKNISKFKQGIQSDMILGVKGLQSYEVFEDVKQRLFSLFHDPENTGRLPMIGLDDEGDLMVIKLSENNKDMEYMSWMEFQTCLICAMFQVHPSDINMATFSSQQAPLFEHTKREELERATSGLMADLMAYSQFINKKIIPKIAKGYEFKWYGLRREMTRREEVELRNINMNLSPDEKRAEEDLITISEIIEKMQEQIELSDEELKYMTMAAQFPQSMIENLAKLQTPLYYVKQQEMQEEQSQGMGMGALMGQQGQGGAEGKAQEQQGGGQQQIPPFLQSMSGLIENVKKLNKNITGLNKSMNKKPLMLQGDNLGLINVKIRKEHE